ncbi:RagB/SusD family nutrient uptake outer membrane protein [Pedobacter nutrimenti]|uniref:SusD-like starch-binding protein associating with outer membrane n=1 Tax=Pedobacter nutrimenti TaxID=1241337 RepID=A0A318UKG7_9SPHI|nr:RagB/SusD family nutrient uptake outer membrane protein [Pedobacter nutrimenti]PYF76543.1 SusD-like starch-binding protein associating with outer membrane [Pedobacter nutrimenti]
MKYINTLFLLSITFFGCKKGFLDAKPNSSIVNPTTLSEYQSLLDNGDVLNRTGLLPQLSSDEYFIAGKSSFDALSYQTQKNTYLWQKDIYGGEINILDWNQIYKAVFISNSVLDGIEKIDVIPANQLEWNNIRGEALFFRSYLFYDLARNFCSVYNETTSTTDLGIPLRLSAGIDVIVQRSTLKETYDRILADAKESLTLLKDDFSTINRNRPSKTAVYALMARIYLSMGNYEEARKAAEACLDKYNLLIDFNNVSTSNMTPFTYNSDEVIFSTLQAQNYTNTTGYGINTAIGIDPNLIQLYDLNDLRLAVFYSKNMLNNYNIKRGYVGGGFYAFTGLATDEVILIKAECQARGNNPEVAMSTLSQLLIKRYKKGTFVKPTSITTQEVLALILKERRKELVWRALRWSDLKRLNKEGQNIILKRVLDGVEYTLEANSPRYTFPIPDDEIALSGIKQNQR